MRNLNEKYERRRQVGRRRRRGSRTGRPVQENRFGSLPDFLLVQVHQMTYQNASLIELSSNPMSFGVDHEKKKHHHVLDFVT